MPSRWVPAARSRSCSSTKAERWSPPTLARTTTIERAPPTHHCCTENTMKWITRERPKVDRIACPWLIVKFIDREAEFLYVPRDEVLRVAQEAGAIPYDVPNVELGHHGELCSFDVFLQKYQLTDSALLKLAQIVR